MDGAGNAAAGETMKNQHEELQQTKKLKLTEESQNGAEAAPLRNTFEGFHLKSTLNEDLSRKTIFVEGTFEPDNSKAVIIMEKTPFGEAAKDILTEGTKLVNNFTNNIYSSYKGFPKAELNGIKATIIHPATDKHIEKYQFHPSFVVNETPEVYQNIVLPHIEANQFSLQWVMNILDHKSEVDRIIFEDTDSETGFILLPDLKWDGVQVSSLYVMALCRATGIRSIRDLTSKHLPLLKNIYETSTKTLVEKYNIPKCKIRAYLHYLPSYYHLHVHFTSIEYEAPGIQPERAHLLNTVIGNIEMIPDYYQKTTLTYCVKDNDELYQKLKNAHIFE